MRWGCKIDAAVVGWGRSFQLEANNLRLDSKSLSGRLPVLGRSGSGKSTLLYLLNFLKRPQRGQVRWLFPDGNRVIFGPNGLDRARSTISMEDIRRHYFGFAYQTSTLTPYLTVGENLHYPLALQGGMTQAEMEEKTYDAVNQVLLCGQGGDTIQGDDSVGALLRRYPNELSGGQLQRVALAQAMIHNPHVLFADGPTGNLDAATRKEVMNVVNKWQEKGDRLLVWVTHHLSDALDSRVSHRLLVSNGRCKLQSSSERITSFGTQ